MLTIARRTSALATKHVATPHTGAATAASIHSTASTENQVAQRGDISELLAGNAAARNSVGASCVLLMLVALSLVRHACTRMYVLTDVSTLM